MSSVHNTHHKGEETLHHRWQRARRGNWMIAAVLVFLALAIGIIAVQ